MKCRACGSIVEHDCPKRPEVAARMAELSKLRNPGKLKHTMAKARAAQKPRTKRNQVAIVCDLCGQKVGKALLQGSIPKWQLEDAAAAMLKLHKEVFHAAPAAEAK